MEVVFAESFVPSALRPDFLRRCASFRCADTGDTPGTVWIRCLLELLYMASTSNLHPVKIPRADLLRACEASTESVGSGLKVGKVAESLRSPCLAVAAKVCAWHNANPELVEWLLALMQNVSLLPSGRMPVNLARRFAERAVVFQGFLRTDEESDALGELILRVVGLGKHGSTTLRKMWHDRGGPNTENLGYALRYRNWALLSGLAQAGSGPGPPPLVFVQFDGDLWECAAAEAPNAYRQNVLEHVLRQFRSAKIRGAIQCSPYKCLATTAIDAAFNYRRQPCDSLLRCVRLFVDAEHVIRGCKCSAYRSVGYDDADMYRLPAWGGDGSSCIASVARRCVELNTRKNADPKRSNLHFNPTSSMLEIIIPRLVEGLKKNKKLTGRMDVFDGTVLMHTRQAIAVLAAAPFLNGNGPWRQQLLAALKGRTSLWNQCIRHMAMCGARIYSQLFAWKSPLPMLNLLEAASVAGAFNREVCNTFSPGSEAIGHLETPDSIRKWALLRVLFLFRAPKRLGHIIHEMQLMVENPDKHPEPTFQTMTALEDALDHPEFPQLLLKGGYKGNWGFGTSWGGASYSKKKKLVEWAGRTGGPRCEQLLRREVGLWQVKPCERYAGWYHLGPAFAKAALCFMTASKRHNVPPELALVILDLAAAIN